MTYYLSTDGACQPNPGKGGWAFILRDSNKKVTTMKKGYAPHTTNNRMELKAVLEGLKYFKKAIWSKSKNPKLHICSDSKYLILGMNQWTKKWQKNGWKRTDGKSILNVDMWKNIYKYKEQLDIKYTHIMGHSGNVDNEKCDKMAVGIIKKHQ